MKVRENKSTHPRELSPKLRHTNHKKHRPTKETPKATRRDTTRARKEEEEAMHGSFPSKNGSPRNGIIPRDTRNKELGEKPTPTPKSP